MIAVAGALALCGAVGASAADNHDAYTVDFVDPAALDATVPAPADYIGHPVGEHAVRYEPLVRYLNALADASPLVTLTPYAESHEGRTLYYITVTSADNHARLSEIQADNAKLADPRKLRDQAEGERIVANAPGVAWMAYSIHGDELSSTDAAVQLAYQLAAGTDDATMRMRDELVIHIDPLMNPDGRERYLAQLQQLEGKTPNPDYQAMQHGGLWSAGRGNHYLFDLNRDWLMQVHPETRGRAAAILSWNPHLLVDSHEMGGLDTYLFDPPREPLSPYVSDKVMQWRRNFSDDQSRAFDQRGWSYYTGDWHEEWYPGYSNAWAALLGSVGLLYEQAGVDNHGIRQATGRVLTFREAVHHQLASSLANLESLRTNRRDVLRDFLADRQWAVSNDGPHNTVFLALPPNNGGDRTTFNRFIDLLDRQGVEAEFTAKPVKANGVVDIWGDRAGTREFPAGTLVVRSNQPHRRLLHAIMEFDPRMSDEVLLDERAELEKRRDSRIYDSTAWNLPMAYGLDAYWAEQVASPALEPAHPLPKPPSPTAAAVNGGFGWLIDAADMDIYLALVRLLDRDCKLRVATKPFTVAGREYQPGAVLIRNNENAADLAEVLGEELDDLNVEYCQVATARCQDGPDLGGGHYDLLQPPRVAIATQWPISGSSYGSIWHLLDDRLHLRVSPINIQRLGGVDLRKYNVLILPDTWSPHLLSPVLDDDALEHLSQWVESGGTLISVGATAAFLADPEREFTSLRLRRDVLTELPEYAEELEREKNARNVRIDPADVWDAEPAGETESDDSLSGAETSEIVDAAKKPDDTDTDTDAARRADEWDRMFHPYGSIVAADLDPEHWLAFGAGEKLPVLLDGDFAFLSKPPLETPARLGGEASLRLSGLLWPEARRRWADTAYVTVERSGRGQKIFFACDPFFRGYYEGSGRLLLNAIILGSGLGAEAPIPW